MPDWTPEKIAGYKAMRDLLRDDDAYVAVAHSHPNTFAVAAPVSEADLLRAERQLGVVLPDELRQLYTRTDGLDVHRCRLIMPLAELVSKNHQLRNEADYRSLYMPFDHLLFFGAAGNGDLFAHGIRMDGSITTGDIFGWNHENDARPWVANGVRDLIARYASGLLLDASG